jgi:hypothetical protein
MVEEGEALAATRLVGRGFLSNKAALPLILTIGMDHLKT